MTHILILQPIHKSRHSLNEDSLQLYRKEGSYSFDVRTVTGCSEISRARCYAAQFGADYLRLREWKTSETCMVLWLDSDMVFEPPLLDKHVELTQRLQLPLAGSYPQRIKPAMAAIRYGDDEHIDELTLRPVLSGMGALMLPAWLFYEQFITSPETGVSTMERIVCSTSVRKGFPPFEDKHTLLSEDFDYCLSFFERPNLRQGVFNLVPGLNYGHVAEKVLVNSDIPRTIPEGLLEPVEGTEANQGPARIRFKGTHEG